MRNTIHFFCRCFSFFIVPLFKVGGGGIGEFIFDLEKSMTEKYI
jgi:hypothetical protein